MFRVVLLTIALAGCAACGKSAGNQEKARRQPTAAGPTAARPPRRRRAGRIVRRARDDPEVLPQARRGHADDRQGRGRRGRRGDRRRQGRSRDRLSLSHRLPDQAHARSARRRDAREDRVQRGQGREGRRRRVLRAVARVRRQGDRRRRPGSYEIKGMFKFGVCDKDSCHPKKQPDHDHGRGEMS